MLLLGDSGVGKTSLVARLTTNAFEREQRATVGVDFARYELAVNGAELVLALWDTSGQERYGALVPQFYRHADALVLVYDTTNGASLDALRRRWWPAFAAHASREPYVVAVLGNKIDNAAARVVTREEGAEFARTLPRAFDDARAERPVHDVRTERPVLHVTCSAKSEQRVAFAFAELAAALARVAPPYNDDDDAQHRHVPGSEPPRVCCTT